MRYHIIRGASLSVWLLLWPGLALSQPLSTAAHAQGYSPIDAPKKMSHSEGLSVELVASEPLVRQPVCIEHDDRGRLWVIQYLQYPNPEGLKRTTVDRYSRTRYDRVPQPPPHGDPGSDRITILSDDDGDGRMDSGHDFVSGLNLATGMAFGHGGVFVLNVPYLLFYPDRDRDDKPDSDPEVLLTGFGMEDAHSVANSLTWGPDGWLYGCQGSTVTANIRGIEFQQGVWRYHPVSKAFELFCEGGGNAWGLDFDADGNLLYSTNYGGYVLVHGVQGGNYVKSFAKHGALHNKHAYGYFEHVPHNNFQGGHVTVGGLIYQGGALPSMFDGQVIAGDLLGHAVRHHELRARGSTFETRNAGVVLDSHDSWFAPTDLITAPDGSLLVSDWHDSRTAHPDPDAQWDRSNGRIYRIGSAIPSASTPGADPSTAAFDISKFSEGQLLALHAHKNQWWVRRARQELARRDARMVMPKLIETATSDVNAQAAVEALWSCITLVESRTKTEPGLTDTTLLKLIDSPHAAVRHWAVRVIGDRSAASEQLAHRLDELAETEQSPMVRVQIAATAARLPAAQAVPMINANINRHRDAEDPYLPLMLWWAVERHSVSGREEVMKRFTRPSLWQSPLGRDVLMPRLVRRYMAEGNQAGLDCVLRILKAAPGTHALDDVWSSMLDGYQEVPSEHQPQRDRLAREHVLGQLLFEQWQRLPVDRQASRNPLTQLLIRFGNRAPVKQALDQIASAKPGDKLLVAALDLLKDAPPPELVPMALQLAQNTAYSESERSTALLALGKLDSPEVAHQTLALLKSTSDTKISSLLQESLCGRPSSSLAWLEQIDAGQYAKTQVALDRVRQMSAHNVASIDALIRKHWGRLDSASPEAKLAEVRRLNNDLRAGAGDARLGQELFKKHCAVCHQFRGEGGKVGPDLTSANRKDRDFLLVSMVDPSSVIRKEYLSVIVRTTDDRILTGVPLAAPNGGRLQLTNARNEVVTIENDEIAEMKESPVSIMPEDLYKQLQPQELRDLFAWLQADP